jgi:hypothetical protein
MAIIGVGNWREEGATEWGREKEREFEGAVVEMRSWVEVEISRLYFLGYFGEVRWAANRRVR